jgi:hypothetical protein
MAKTILILFAFISALSAPAGNPGQPHQGQSQQTSQPAAIPPESAIKVTIATVGSFLGPPTDHYKVGQQIPVIITMTNTSTGPLNACISSDLYQNLPRLTKNGELVPYMKWQSYERLNAQRNHTCKEENLPEPVLLTPNEPVQADFFVLADSPDFTGAEAWYDTLPAGKYELSIQRRFSCCDGPMVESNKISFEITP